MKSVIRLTQILWPLRKFEDPNVYLQVDAFAHIELKRAGEYVVPMSFHLMTVVGHLTMCVCVRVMGDAPWGERLIVSVFFFIV